MPGRPTYCRIVVGQGPTALAVGAGGGCLDIFLSSITSLFFLPSLWETTRYRLKYCLKGPLSPKQPTNQLKPENYRPISLTSVSGKILERIIGNEIVELMTSNSLFSRSQHGFLAGKSCSTQLLEFLEAVSYALDQGTDVDVIYIWTSARHLIKSPIKGY